MTITPTNYLSVFPTLPQAVRQQPQIMKRHEHFEKNAKDLSSMVVDSISMKTLMSNQIMAINKELKGDEPAKGETKVEKMPSPSPEPKKEVAVMALNPFNVLERMAKVQSVEVKHMKRFLKLLEYSTKNNVQDALSALQTDNKKGLFSVKTSEAGPELEAIGKLYTKLLSEARGRYQVDATKALTDKVTALSQAEKIDPSVDILIKYLKLEGREPHQKEVEGLQVLIAKIDVNDTVFADDVKKIESYLTNWKPGETLRNIKVSLDGMPNKNKGLSGTYVLDGLETDLGCTNAPAINQRPVLIAATDLAGIEYESIPFGTSKFAELFGEIPKNVAIMIWGEPGAGKSTLSMQLALFLGKNQIKTLYFSAEEYMSKALKERMLRSGGSVENLFFTENLGQINASYQVVILDSTNSMRLSFETYKELRGKYPKICFVLIMQATKGGQFKGNKLWEHEVDIVAKVSKQNEEASIAQTTKNRFQPLSSVEVF